MSFIEDAPSTPKSTNRQATEPQGRARSFERIVAPAPEVRLDESSHGDNPRGAKRPRGPRLDTSQPLISGKTSARDRERELHRAVKRCPASQHLGANSA